jgi:LemA protein
MLTIIIVLAVLLIPVVLVGLYAVSQYNKLVKLDQRYQSLYSDIDVQLQRRHDLIPQLVNTAKGAMKHEEKIFQALADARKQAERARKDAKASPGDPEAMKNLAAAEQMLDKQISGFMIQVEDNPELQANENMLKLQEQLQTTENKVSFARQAYNDGVRAYNTARESFPTVIIANMFNYGEAEYFEVDTAEVRDAPEVSFD